MAVQDDVIPAIAVAVAVAEEEEEEEEEGNSTTLNDEKIMPLLLRIILSDANDRDTTDTTASASASDNSTNLRNLSLTKAVSTLSTTQLLNQLTILDEFSRRREGKEESNSNDETTTTTTTNLYQRVRALFFCYAVHRFHLPERRRRAIEKEKKKNSNRRRMKHDDDDDTKSEKSKSAQDGEGEKKTTNNNNTDEKTTEDDATFICPKGYAALLDRRFDEAIDYFLEWVSSSSSSTLILSPDDDDDDDDGYDGYDGYVAQKNDTDDKEKKKKKGYYPVPRTTSLISNLTFSRDGPSVITYTTPDADSSGNHDNNNNNASSSSSSSSSRGYCNSSNSSSFFSVSSHLSSEKATTTATASSLPLLLPSEATSSALAKSYRSLAFQTLADQVKRSVRSHDGNEWMFNVVNVTDTPLCWSEELLLLINNEEEGKGDEEEEENNNDASPMLVEKTPVRMDLSHVSSLYDSLVCSVSICSLSCDCLCATFVIDGLMTFSTPTVMLVGHFLSRDGLPRGGKGSQLFRRPGRSSTRGWGSAATGADSTYRVSNTTNQYKSRHHPINIY